MQDKFTFRPALLGFALVFSFESLFSLEPFLKHGPLGDFGVMTLNISAMAACIALAIYGKRGETLLDRPTVAVGAATTAFLAYLAMVIWHTVMPTPACAALVCVISICLAALKLFWYELYASIPSLVAVPHFIAAHGLSAVAIIVFPLIASRPLSVVLRLAFLPASLACLQAASQHIGRSEDREREQSGPARWTFPIKLVLLLVVFTLTNILIRTFLPSNTRVNPAVGVLVVMALFFVVALRDAGVIEMRLLYGLSFLLIITGTLGLLFVEGAPITLGSLCTNAGYSCMNLAMFVLFCETSRRYEASPLWLFGILGASLTAGKLLGKLAEMLTTGLDTTILCACLVLLLAVMFTLTICDRGLTDTFAIVHRVGEKEDRSSLDVMVERCARIARTYGLTRREEEVFYFLAQGFEPAEVAERLSLAESTVKSHSKHIYAKTDIHSRQELLELARASR